MSATDYLKKAVEYDMSGRKMESLKLYQSGISALLDLCKSIDCLLPHLIKFNKLIQFCIGR